MKILRLILLATLLSLTACSWLPGQSEPEEDAPHSSAILVINGFCGFISYC